MDANAYLEIDHERGVIYVHDAATGVTKVRIGGLPHPIPLTTGLIDIIVPTGVSYTPPSPNELDVYGRQIVPRTERRVLANEPECTGANDETCPKHPGIKQSEKEA